MREIEDVIVVAQALCFPEGPVALADGSLLIVEILAGRVRRIHADGAVETVAVLGGGPNGLARGPDGALYVCNRGLGGSAGIQRVDLETGTHDMLYTACDGEPLKRPNDLVFDATGSFWFTDRGSGQVCYARPDGSAIHSAWTGLDAPHGIGLSPDGKVLYVAQMHRRQIVQRRIASPGRLVPSPGYDTASLVATGEMDPGYVLAGLSGAQEVDSMALDSRGALCVGTLMESGITIISPEGTVIDKFLLPSWLTDPLVTNICFGGSDMQTAYITLSGTGRVIACRWPISGMRLHFQDI